MTPPLVSVVVCCYTLERLPDVILAVESVQRQVTERIEILVVVDHNPALAAELRARFPGERVVENTGPQGLSGARNTAVGASSAELMAFLDDDARAAPGWLDTILTPFVDPTVVAVGGLAVADWQAGRPGWFPPEFDWVVGCTHAGSPTSRAVVRNVIGCNMAFRRAAVEAAGGFRTDLGRVGRTPLGCEETELCIRLGLADPAAQVVYVPEARVDHTVPPSRGTPRYFYARCYAEGISKALVSTFVGSQAALSTERAYTSRVLPLAVGRNLSQLLTRRELGGVGRAAAIVSGFSVTAAGYLVGRVSRRRAPTRESAP